MVDSESLIGELEGSIGQKKLLELKNSGCDGFVSDYDGTLIDSTFSPGSVTRLIYNVGKELTPTIATARGVTFRRDQLAEIVHATDSNRTLKPIYISLGNGTQVLKIENGQTNTIYDNSLSIAEDQQIINAYQQLGIVIPSEMDRIRQADLRYPWGSLIPVDYLTLSRGTSGVWIEPIKASLLTGSAASEDSRRIGQELASLLPDYQVRWGGKPVIDVTKKIIADGREIDGKLFTAHIIMTHEGLSELQIAAFGDTPDGNDAALLSLPFSFTNRVGYEKGPYSLPDKGTKVQRIQEAIYFLAR